MRKLPAPVEVVEPVLPKPDPIHFPPKLDFLFKPKRFKVPWGGRDAGRSWGVARALLVIGAARPLRILCAREIQKTLADSVMALLKDQIERLGLEKFYHIQENSITGQNGTEFIFTGLRDIDANKVKSYEGVDIVWVEEAETLTKKSFNILEPTIRKLGSELWFTFNAQLDTDFIYDYFVVSTPEDAFVVKMTWQDNPWYSEVLENGRERMKRTDPMEYDNIWLGNCRRAIAGAIYAKEITDLIEKKRARPMPYDPQLPVHTIWDLGWNDAMSIIMVQKIASAVMIIGYLESSFKTYAECVKELNTLKYVWGTDYLPFDGKQTRPDTGKNPKQILEGLGRRNVEAMEHNYDPEHGIKMVRMMFPRMYIDNSEFENTDFEYDGGKRLIECLKRYRRKVPVTTGEPSTPVHDEFCFTGDTEVLTRHGKCQIMNLGIDEVLTPCGYAPFKRLGITIRNAPLVEVTFNNGYKVRCTPEHLFLTVEGWRSASSLTSTTLILSSLTLSRSISMVSFGVCGRVIGTSRAAIVAFIVPLGRWLSDQFQKVATYITKTTTQRITLFQILNACLPQNTLNSLGEKQEGLAHSMMRQKLGPKSGMRQRMVNCGIVDMLKRQSLELLRAKKQRVLGVASHLMALFAELTTKLRRNTVPRFASSALQVASVEPLPYRSDVWCISVPDGRWFTLANGAVVHNSHGADATRLLAIVVDKISNEYGTPPPLMASYGVLDRVAGI